VRFSSSRPGLAAILLPITVLRWQACHLLARLERASGRCCGTKASAHPDCIGAHSISVLARSVCWSEQQRLEEIGRAGFRPRRNTSNLWGPTRDEAIVKTVQLADIGRAAAPQLPITEFAHKAANGNFPLVAATGIARSARAPLPASGWPNAKPTCCRSATSMSSSRCRPRSRT
jgi:hypothetical protein